MSFVAGPKPALHGLTSRENFSGKVQSFLSFPWSLSILHSSAVDVNQLQHWFMDSDIPDIAAQLPDLSQLPLGSSGHRQQKLRCLCTCLSFSAASSLWRSLGSANFSQCPSWNQLQGWIERFLRTGENGSFEEKDNAKLISMASGSSGYGYIKMYLNTGIKWELLAPSAVVQ